MDNNNINDIMGKLKALVKKGNVSRIVICKDEKELVNIPVNVGIVGGVVGLAAAKWVVIAAVLATVGFGCTVQVIKEDGEVSDVYGKEQAEPSCIPLDRNCGVYLCNDEGKTIEVLRRLQPPTRE